MKHLLLAISLFISIKPFAQTGAIAGNVYFLYNKYQGNKPDVGSDVYLYPIDSTQKALQKKCDLRGDFKYDNLTPGKYLLLVTSENTNSNGRENFFALKDNPVQNYFGFNIMHIDTNLSNKILYLDSLINFDASPKKVTMWNAGKFLKQRQKQEKEFEETANVLFKKLPIGSRFNGLLFHPLLHKIFVKEVEIKPNETESVVVDFHINYSKPTFGNN